MAGKLSHRLLAVAVVVSSLFISSAARADEIIIGTGDSNWAYPMNTGYRHVRTQTIYLEGEIGAPCSISSLALYVTEVPGQRMKNFTIRMRHTDLSIYGESPVWESANWTTVYQTNQTVSMTGWVQLNFATPFAYNGIQNLMVDISFSTLYYTWSGSCRYSLPGGIRSLYCGATGSYGDPLAWSSQTPVPSAGIYVPNVKLGISVWGAVAIPAMSPKGGVYTSGKNVTLTSATIGATIHYTTNGVEPDTNDLAVASGSNVFVDRSVTLKAKAWKDGIAPSAVKSGMYTIVVAAPSFSPVGGIYDNEQNVTVTCTTAGATIHYTTNGSDPNESNPIVLSGESVYVDHTLTLKAKAWKDGLTPSTVRSGSYTLKVGTPSFSPAAGTHNTEQNVTVTCATAGATIRYTANGNDPNESDPVVLSGDSVYIDHALTLKAKAWKEGMMPSAVNTGGYVFQVATPSFVPPAGTYTVEQDVIITSATPGATIHYTTSEVDPTESDPVVASGGSVQVHRNSVMKAGAWKAGYLPSGVSRAVYAIGMPTPGFTMGGRQAAWGGKSLATMPLNHLTQVVGGARHSLGLKEDGSVVAWGSNNFGECDVPSPNADFVAVAGGQNHSLGLKADGSIRAWGNNGFGQCNIPFSNSGFVAVTAGYGHSVVLKANGSIVAWGANWDNQCNLPVPNGGFVAIATSYAHSVGLKADGSVVAWGWNQYGQCDVPSPNSGFVAVAAGAYHSLGLKSDGSVVAWGDNSYSQCQVPSPNSDFLGVAASGCYSLGLKADGSIVAWGKNDYEQCSVPSGNSDFAAVATGWWHAFGLKGDGSVVMWGDNGRGQCDVSAPNMGFVAVAAGWSHALGLKLDGSIVAWGANGYGGCNVPSPNNGFVGVAAGYGSSLGLKTDGSVVAWGLNDYGQCDVPSPNSSFVAVAAGRCHSLGVKTDGSITAWGAGEPGESGGPNYGQCVVPAPNSAFTAAAAGNYHSLGLRTDGSVVAWGANWYGQCDVPSPNSGFVAVAAGENHSLGLKMDGSVVIWGRNDYGQCDIPLPNTDFVAIAAGRKHNLGLKAYGSITAWGENSHGQCNVPLPNAIFKAVAAGDEFSLAIAGCPYILAGDLSDDCRVDFRDLAFFATRWLTPAVGSDCEELASMVKGWLIDCWDDPNMVECVAR